MAADSERPRGDEQSRLAELTAIGDPLRRLVLAATMLERMRHEQLGVARVRDGAMAELHDQGLSYAAIARAAGTTRGRVAQVVRRHRIETLAQR